MIRGGLTSYAKKPDFQSVWLHSDEKKIADEESLPLRPYWCFIIDKDDPMLGDYCLSAEAILVDMQTGEIVPYIEVNNQVN